IKSCREAMGTYSASLDCQKWGDAFPEFSLFFKNPTKKNFINNYTCLEFFIENNVLNGSQIALIKSTIERINTLKKPTESICFYTYLIKQAVLNHYARNKKVDDIPTFIELIRAGNAERALSLFATSNNKKMIAKEQDAVGITSLMAALYLPTTDHSQE